MNGKTKVQYEYYIILTEKLPQMEDCRCQHNKDFSDIFVKITPFSKIKIAV